MDNKISSIIIYTMAAIGFSVFIGFCIFMYTKKETNKNNEPIEGYYGGGTFYSCGNLYYEGPRFELTEEPQVYKIPYGAYYSFWDDEGKTPQFTFHIQNAKTGIKKNSNEVTYIATREIWVSYSGPGKKFVSFAHTW